MEKTKTADVYYNLAGEPGEPGERSIVELPGVTPGTNWQRFRAEARAYLRDHENPPSPAAATPWRGMR